MLKSPEHQAELIANLWEFQAPKSEPSTEPSRLASPGRKEVPIAGTCSRARQPDVAIRDRDRAVAVEIEDRVHGAGDDGGGK